MKNTPTGTSIEPDPLIGSRLAFGTYRVGGARAVVEVRRALERGIRSIDTARLYKNEDEVYGAIRAFEAENPGASPVFVCSKVHKNMLFDDTVRAVEDSVRRLGRPLDRMLLHRPLPNVMWRALDACVDRGLVSQIGVSNYPVERLAALLEICAPQSPGEPAGDGAPRCRRPVVHQVEIHPFVGAVHPLLSYCKAEGVAVQGHTMLARGEFLTYPALVRLAAKYGVSPAVILLRWADQLGVELLVHTSQEAHLDEIIASVVTRVPLEERDMAEISGYHCVTTHRFFVDPSPRFPDRELDAITDTGKYIEAVASRLAQDRAAQAAGTPVSRTALSLNTQSTREILTDPVANQIALRLFPPAEGKPNESSYQRYRDLIRSLRNRANNEQQSRPKSLSCSLPADHAALQAEPADASPLPIVKGRPVSPLIARPTAMPVEVAPAAELEPFFRFLADPGAFAPDELSTPLTFSRGTYFPDHRMDLCKQVVGPTSIEDLCDAVEQGHETPEEREETGTPLTFTRGTYFPDQRMDLCKQVVGPDHIGRLCEAVEAQNDGRVEQRHRVRHFLLGNNIACDGASTAGAQAMARLMANPAVDIETWYLAGNCIGPADIDVLATALESNRHAQALWLKRNPIGIDGGAHLGRMLGQNETLELLDLHNTGLFDEGVEALCQGLAGTGKRLSLQHLYLSANALTERSLGPLTSVLRSALPEPCSLVSLYLSINRLGNEALPVLVELINTGALAKLERLDLGSVGLQAPCLGPLVDALLRRCPRLRSLNLGTYLSTRDLGETANELAGDVPAMKRLLQEHRSLELLDISTCGLSATGGQDLVDVLGPRQSLHGVGGHALQHSHLERRLLKHPECVLHIDSIYRGRA